jgi:hypothetical protein
MSQAFVKEEEEQWLHEIQPTVNALIVYLTRQNNGIRVYEKSTEHSTKCKGIVIHHMSNGLSYVHNDEGKWAIVL